MTTYQHDGNKDPTPLMTVEIIMNIIDTVAEGHKYRNKLDHIDHSLLAPNILGNALIHYLMQANNIEPADHLELYASLSSDLHATLEELDERIENVFGK